MTHRHDYRYIGVERNARGRWFRLFRCECGAELREWI